MSDISVPFGLPLTLLCSRCSIFLRRSSFTLLFFGLIHATWLASTNRLQSCFNGLLVSSTLLCPAVPLTLLCPLCINALRVSLTLLATLSEPCSYFNLTVPDPPCKNALLVFLTILCNHLSRPFPYLNPIVPHPCVHTFWTSLTIQYCAPLRPCLLVSHNPKYILWSISLSFHIKESATRILGEIDLHSDRMRNK